MKKLKKLVLSSALALSTLGVVSVSETEQASAVNSYWSDKCKNDDLCMNLNYMSMRVGTENGWAHTKVEIISGAASGLATVTADGKKVKALKPGEVVAKMYDRTGVETGKYTMYVLTLK
ncbi:hypothetical protein C7Y47_24400 [Lysinibacillus sphaericus]|uniref:Uncharacterized protein n=1 Tax=Lysinibacillus sphaericus TaxID=1421 RepID=A0A544U4E5_LYSSH|nr:hypothetical protein [Lysinibacillus sp. SDF0037]TQR25634.1 hypothetical protein C7Y47_24400 [Lysinibacillus sp. SDF0037]